MLPCGIPSLSGWHNPCNAYDADAKPSGTPTKIIDKMDDITRRSLTR